MVVDRFDPDLARACKYFATIDTSVPFLSIMVHAGSPWGESPTHEDVITLIVDLESAIRRVPVELDAPFEVRLKRARAWAGGALAGLLDPDGAPTILRALEMWTSVAGARIASDDSLREARARLAEIGWRARGATP